MGRSDACKPWTRPADVRETVDRKLPVLLMAFLAGQDWEPLHVSLRGPGPAEIGERLADVQAWAAEWDRAGRGPLRVECRKVGGRLIGTTKGLACVMGVLDAEYSVVYGIGPECRAGLPPEVLKRVSDRTARKQARALPEAS